MTLSPLNNDVHIDLAGLIDMRHYVNQIQLPSKTIRRGALSGAHHSKLRGRGIDFDQVRLYQPGDDIRNIDWRVTARTQKPHTKIFHEEREQPVYLIVEQSQSLFFSSRLVFKSVLAAQAASLIGWVSLSNNDRVGGLIFSDTESYQEIKPRRGHKSLLHLLENLAKANHALPAKSADQNIDSLAIALSRANEVLKPGSLVVILCDERSLTQSSIKKIYQLARHCHLILLPIHDPIDHELPQSSHLTFTDTQSLLEINTCQSMINQKYMAQAEERIHTWKKLATHLRCPLLPLTTDQLVTDQLITLHSLHHRVS